MNLLAFIRSPITWVVLAVIGTAIVLGWTFDKGETAGGAAVTAAVEHTTNVEIEKARKDKDVADEKVRIAAPDTVIDSTH
jgi:hypothetical protein